MIENAARFDQGFDPTTCVVPCLETYRKSMGRIAKGNDGAVSTRFAHSCTVVVFVVIQYPTVSTPRSTRPGSLVSWLPKSGDSYIKPQYWKLVGETRGPLLDVSNGRCPSPVSMTWPLRSSALQILYVISTAFFNATEIPVSTCHNSWTKWALINYCAPSPEGASQRLGNWIDENVLYPWALAETCECEAFVVDCTAGFDMSELQGSRRLMMIFGSGPSL